MNGFDRAASASLMRRMSGRTLPEHRKIELYSSALEVKLPDPDGRANPWNVPQVMDALNAFLLLDVSLEAQKPHLAGLDLRGRFLALEPTNRMERLTAQVYRLLKVLRRGASAPGARVQAGEGVFQVNYVEHPYAFGLRVTFSGLELLAAFTALYLDFKDQPHPEAYVEAMLSQYYEDIAAEVRYLSDEEGSVLHYRKPFFFNRHHRYQCRTARFALEPENLVIEIGERYADTMAFPVDFVLLVEGVPHIIPCEVLKAGRLPLRELDRWKARTPGPQVGPPTCAAAVGAEVTCSVPVS